jgi:hypothetical protein
LLTAQITGGLGNQLFTYAKLALHARDNNLELGVDGSIAERVLGRPADLFDFRLGGEKRIDLSDYGSLDIQAERILWKSKQLRRITRRYQDTSLGGQSSIPQVRDGWKVRGFFQTFDIAERLILEIGRGPLALIQESHELQRRTLEVKKHKSIAIHMRRGDYLNYKDSFGVLEDNYYLSALEIMLAKSNFEKVYIFSDSPESVLGFKKQIKLDSEIVLPSELSTSETLVLISRCDAILTSNSTFSFWAAILADHNQVIYPAPWFRSADEWLRSSNFSLPKWMPVNSIWKN